MIFSGSSSEDIVGIVLLLVSLFCLGTWPALLRLASSLEVEAADDAYASLHVQQEGRHHSNVSTTGPQIQVVCHAYLDYATAYFITSSVPFVIVTLIMTIDDNTSLSQAVWQIPPFSLIAVAMLGGTLLSMGNLSFQWATAVFQGSLTLVLAIQASLTILLGTGVNYGLQPDKTHQPLWLVAGIGCFLLAIGVAVQSQLWLEQQSHNKHKDEAVSTTMLLPVAGEIEMANHHQTSNTNYDERHPQTHGETTFFEDEPNSSDANQVDNIINDASQCPTNVPCHAENDTPTTLNHVAVVNAHPHHSISRCHEEEYPSFINNVAHHPKIQQQQKQSSVVTALMVAFLGGLSFGFFSPCFNVAVNDPFDWTTTTTTTTGISAADDDSVDESIHETLRVARANLVFSFAFWLASMVGNIWLLKQAQRHQEDTASLSVGALLHRYFCTRSFADRKLAVAAGSVCAMGNVLQFQGGQRVGYATADLVQAYPLVSTVWDVLWFGEFQTLQWPSRLAFLLVSMYLAYIGGVILFAGSSIGDD